MEAHVREYSIPALTEVPASASLADVVFRRGRQQPDAVMLRRRTGNGRWQDVTAGQFLEQVTALAKGLMAAGIEPGDRVGLMSRCRYEWTLIDYAILAAGGVTVPIYETSSTEQVEWMLGDSGARAAFAETSAHAATIGAARGSLPGLTELWLIDGGGEGGGGEGGGDLGAVTAGAAQVTDEQLEQRRTTRAAADLATIIYTSGTTGRPKGCELSHGNLLSGVRNAADGALPQLFDQPGSSTLLFLTLAHSFARTIQIGCLEAGAILGHWPDTSTVAQGLVEFRPTFLLGVPRVFEKAFNTAKHQASANPVTKRIFSAAVDTAIASSRSAGDRAGAAAGAGGLALRLRHGLFDRLVYARLRAGLGGQISYAVSGGGALGERLGHFFRGAGITVLEGYGLTETSAAITVNRPGRNKIGTVGLPLPGARVRIADDGEILLKGPNVFARYWQNEAATAAAFTDGWFASGDLGALDDEGFLTVTGRKKDLIVTAGGTNVAPEVLEDRLRANPLISQCMVVGDGRPFVACLVTLDTEALEHWKQQHGRPAEATPEQLRDDPELIAEIQAAVDDANKAVSRAESIRKFRILGSDFTEANGYLTPSLKVRRNVVAKDYAADIEALYTQP
jgi:long-chain acyl-CoA synthetase